MKSPVLSAPSDVRSFHSTRGWPPAAPAILACLWLVPMTGLYVFARAQVGGPGLIAVGVVIAVFVGMIGYGLWVVSSHSLNYLTISPVGMVECYRGREMVLRWRHIDGITRVPVPTVEHGTVVYRDTLGFVVKIEADFPRGWEFPADPYIDAVLRGSYGDIDEVTHAVCDLWQRSLDPSDPRRLQDPPQPSWQAVTRGPGSPRKGVKSSPLSTALVVLLCLFAIWVFSADALSIRWFNHEAECTVQGVDRIPSKYSDLVEVRTAECGVLRSRENTDAAMRPYQQAVGKLCRFRLGDTTPPRAHTLIVDFYGPK